MHHYTIYFTMCQGARHGAGRHGCRAGKFVGNQRIYNSEMGWRPVVRVARRMPAQPTVRETRRRAITRQGLSRRRRPLLWRVAAACTACLPRSTWRRQASGFVVRAGGELYALASFFRLPGTVLRCSICLAACSSTLSASACPASSAAWRRRSSNRA